MKSIVVTPKNGSEFKVLCDLLKKPGISSSALSYDDLEDFGRSKVLRDVDKIVFKKTVAPVSEFQLSASTGHQKSVGKIA